MKNIAIKIKMHVNITTIIKLLEDDKFTKKLFQASFIQKILNSNFFQVKIAYVSFTALLSYIGKDLIYWYVL